MGSATLYARPRPARLRAALRSPAGLIAAFAALFYGVFIARTAFAVDGRTYFTLFDDAMVSMRYGRNLAEGGGLVWNAGQDPVEGYTNFLWTLWMAVVHLTGAGDARTALVVMVSGAAILIANLFVVRAIVRTLAPGREAVALAAMAATAVCYPLVYWTLRGMEVGLLSLLISLMALYAVRLEREFDIRSLAKLAAVMAAAVLTRDDALVPCVVVGALVVLRCDGHRARCVAILGGAVAATIGAHEAFRLLYYDALLPNTYELKMGGVGLGDRVSRGSAILANVTWTSLYVPIALAGAALAARRRGAGLLVAVFAAQAAYSVYVGGDAWEFMNAANRFLTPTLPLLLVAAVLGFAALTESRPRAGRGALLAGLGVIGALHAAAGLAGRSIVKLPDVGAGGTITSRQEVAAALGTGLLAAAIGLAFAAREDRAARLVWPAFAVALIVATSGAQLDGWRWDNAAYAKADAEVARYGVHLKEATPPATTVAVAWAGAIPYFDRRPSIDLLGKSDRTIARRPPHPGELHPGHMKWDYEHSIRRLRPDVVAQLWRPTAADLGLLAREGYADLSGSERGRVYLFARAGMPLDALRRARP